MLGHVEWAMACCASRPPLTRVGGGLHAIFNVTSVVDCLDESASTVRRFKSGSISKVDKYVFADSMLSASIFRLPQLVVPIFVGEPFVKAVLDAGLTGFSCVPLWSSDGSI